MSHSHADLWVSVLNALDHINRVNKCVTESGCVYRVVATLYELSILLTCDGVTTNVMTASSIQEIESFFLGLTYTYDNECGQ
jgi:tRNA(Phe) wybutosine-synthesizing methylase Tyw3